MESFKLKENKITVERVFSWAVILGVLVAVAFGMNYFSGSKWSLFFYPDGCLGCQDEWIIEIDKYSSLEQCLQSGENMRSDVRDSFECGHRCERFDESGYMCDETVDY